MFQRTMSDFWRAFEVQKDALDISSLAFDIGLVGESARLAASTFLLVGRGMRTNKPILDHLGILNRVQFFTTVPENSQSGSPLLSCSITMIRENVAQIELQGRGREAMMNGRSLSYSDWWDEVVLNDGISQSLTREKIIRILRDKDGGAHYDANVSDPLIISALKGEISGFNYQSGGTTQPVRFSLEHTMRQIAEELRRTIKHLRIQNDPAFQLAADAPTSTLDERIAAAAANDSSNVLSSD